MKFVLISFAILLSTFAAQAVESGIEPFEEILLKDFKDKKISVTRRFYLYLLAGREFYSYGKLELSRKYYTKAIELKSVENKKEAYVNLIAIALRKKNKDLTKKRVGEIESYFKAHPKFKTGEITEYLKLVKQKFIGDKKITIKDYSLFNRGLYRFQIIETEMEQNIKEKKFAKALSFFDGKSIQKQNVSYQIMYDLLRVLVSGKNISKEKLLCSSVYKAVPHDYAYPTMICRGLHEYLSGKKLSKKTITDLSDYFKEYYSEKSFLLTALKELK